ncbi:hypothetical protein U6L75_00275 [Cutibacterium acnes]|jgi:hypothetical protein|nr:hypothetical protein PAST3_03564 [Cutibacterium acnes HL201PA1]WGH37867.1 hypothetical protein OYC58_002467 [Cutibacterium acnes]WGH40010.1 hypothetical protein OYC57_002449 [Cutibacterium acnes]GAE70684.1 hypothetical protein JCM18909_4060 [Cutibacterium acnes JCM 18909]
MTGTVLRDRAVLGMKVVDESRFGRVLAVRLCRWVLWRWPRVEFQSSVVSSRLGI